MQLVWTVVDAWAMKSDRVTTGDRAAIFELALITPLMAVLAPCHPTQRNTIVCADLVGPGTAAGGSSGADAPVAGDVTVVRLVEQPSGSDRRGRPATPTASSTG